MITQTAATIILKGKIKGPAAPTRGSLHQMIIQNIRWRAVDNETKVLTTETKDLIGKTITHTIRQRGVWDKL